MCFSATASFTSAVVISTIGLISLLKAQTFPMKLFAATPLFFALQQALEGIVWVTLMNNDKDSLLSTMGIYSFLFFAGVFWPIWVSASLFFVERDKKRKKWLLITFIIGLTAALDGAFQLIRYSQTANIIDNHLSYPIFICSSTTFLSTLYFYYVHGAYVFASIAPFFISKLRYVWLMGAILATGCIVAKLVSLMGFGSLWCFFGALSSLVIYLIVASYNKKIAYKQKDLVARISEA